MTYGLNPLLPAKSARSAGGSRDPGFAAWRKLDEQTRLQLVERVLKPANDLIDAYPIAL